jgi:hypothetical protein
MQQQAMFLCEKVVRKRFVVLKKPHTFLTLEHRTWRNHSIQHPIHQLFQQEQLFPVV